ncbi:MAG: 5-formyltetrahydrofolate cyclo-ligase [Deltaproteobacteria bacterium]|nr:5-formyltetrahydrofolate cyclo-ligase [Deltaproteobacteria bacterium]
MVAPTKQEIRKEILARRQALSAGEIDQRSQRIYRNFIGHLDEILPKQFSTAAIYFPIRGEVDTRPFHKFFKNRKVRCLFPRVADVGSKDSLLDFYPVDDWSELQLGSFGIGEPAAASGAAIRPDVVMVPGLAYSHDAHRLGFGGGYYDRTIDSWTASGIRSSVKLIGLSYEFQVLQQLPCEPHDHQLDFVVSEEQVLKGAVS